jgi:hypothetical protein
LEEMEIKREKMGIDEHAWRWKRGTREILPLKRSLTKSISANNFVFLLLLILFFGFSSFFLFFSSYYYLKKFKLE